MLIKDIFANSKPVISFEIFPPKNGQAIDSIYEVINSLKKLTPDFISVTYGAGGSSKDRTVEIASTIKNTYNIESLAHLTGITSSEEEIADILEQLKGNNITNILALRGDTPKEFDYAAFNTIQYKYAKDLINYIRNTHHFCIGGAAYPEGHIECKDMQLSLMHLKEKVDMGLDFLITQLFFDNNYYYEFKEMSYKLGINIPISVGIMPVFNVERITKIVSLCGVSIPPKLTRIIEKYYNNPDSILKAGIDYTTKQIADLLSNGVDGIHIYTMNNPKITADLIKNIFI